MDEKRENNTTKMVPTVGREGDCHNKGGTQSGTL